MAADQPPPDPTTLRKFLRGDLPAAEWEAVADAIERDPAAAGTLAALDDGDTLQTALRGCPVLPDDPAAPALVGRLTAGNDQTSEYPPTTLDGTAYPFLAPPAAPDEIGRLGGYRVLRVLGSGGMGVVFEAEDEKLGRRVALKAVRPERLSGPTARKRFLNEARAAAAVESDHVAAVYQADEVGGVPYLTMPLLRGRSLDDRLADGAKLPIADVLAVGRQSALGLSAAHARGLVHRDIKPANLFLEDQGGGFRVKVLDFGLARADADDSLTRDGMVVGTPSFMAPEQARGGPVDARTDLFALGVVLYRAATGALPFRGTDTPSVLLALTADAPTHPHRLRPDLPPRLADLILRLLEKDPARRPASAKAVADELADIERQYSSPALPRRRSRVALALAAMAAVLLAGIVVVIRDRNGKQITIDVPDGGKLTVDADGRATVTVPGTQPANPPAAPTSSAAPTATRTAAAALQAFGRLQIDTSGQILSVGPTDPLPVGPFRIHCVGPRNDLPVTPARRLLDLVADVPDFGGIQDLEGRLTFTEADLEHMAGRPYAATLAALSSPNLDLSDRNLDNLKRFPKLTALGGRATDFDDARFKRLAVNLPNLWHLVLFNFDTANKATPAGLAELGKTRLGELYLFRPRRLTREECRVIAGQNYSHLAVTNADFDNALLAELAATRAATLSLHGTKVTAAGAQAFAAAHPKCNIGWDGGSIERALALDTPDNPFAVLRDGKEVSAHKSLAAAIVAAHSSDVIEVRGDGPHRVGNVPRVDGRDVTLRAAAGSRPRIVAAAGYDPQVPWLAVAGGNLRMEGLEWSGSEGVWFWLPGGACEIRRCRLLKWGDGPAVQCDGSGVVLADCVLTNGSHHAIIEAGGTVRAVEITGCAYFSPIGNGLLTLGRAAGQDRTLRLAGNTVIAPDGNAVWVQDPPAGQSGTVAVTADRNVFLVERVMQWSDLARKAATKAVTWRGTENMYLAPRMGGSTFEKTDLLLGWDDWKKHWGDAETAGRREQPPIRSFTAPVRDDMKDGKLDRSPAVVRELRKQFPDTGADPDNLFDPRR